MILGITHLCTLQAIVLFVLGRCFLIYTCYFADPLYLSYCLSKESFTRGMMFRTLLILDSKNQYIIPFLTVDLAKGHLISEQIFLVFKYIHTLRNKRKNSHIPALVSEVL